MLDLNVSTVESWSVVSVVGRLDTVATPQFEQQCAEWIAAGHHRLVLDFAALEYISSSGLSSIVTTAQRLQAAGGKIAVANLRGIIKEVFSITGFDTIIPTYPDVESVVKSEA